MAAIEVAESALLVEVPDVEPSVGAWRERYDPVARRGVPAHVTALFPFRRTIDDECLATIADIAGATPAMPTRFERLDEFPGVVWLRPEPDQPFRDLTARLWQAFPDRPPYGNRFPDPQPHLTVAHLLAGEPQEEVREILTEAIGPALPVSCSLGALSLFVSDGQRWSRHAAFSFGPN